MAAGSLVPHCHLGMQQVLMDYIHPRKFPVIGTGATVLLYTFTALTLVGLFKLAVFDMGITKSVKILMNL